MDTIWGCDTETMDELAAEVVERVERLIALFDALRGASAAVTWTGPDADDHRARTATVARQGADLCGILREHARRLHDESAQQSDASRADPFADPGFAVRAGGIDPLRAPFTGTGSATAPRSGKFTLFPEVDPGFRHPIDHEKIAGVWRKLNEPWSIPPFAGPFVPRLPHHGGELPQSEEYGLTQESLERGELARRTALRGNVYTAGGQAVLDAHTMAGEALDGAEAALIDSGHDEFTPAVSLARVPLDASSLLIGENSTAAGIVHGVDHLFANYSQAGGEVIDALGEGDLAGAARAMERGGYRHLEALGEMATSGPISEVPGVSADMAGHAADAVEPVSPEAADSLRDLEHAHREIADRVEGVRESVLDSETWYDMRRREAPLPWDAR